MTDFIRPIRITLRGLGRTPAFTIAAVTILGLGIGTAVAVFTVFRAVLYQRIPVPDPDRVVQISTYRDDPSVEFGLVKSDLKVIKQQSRTIRSVGGYAHWGTSQGPLVDGDRTLTLGRVVVSGVSSTCSARVRQPEECRGPTTTSWARRPRS